MLSKLGKRGLLSGKLRSRGSEYIRTSGFTPQSASRFREYTSVGLLKDSFKIDSHSLERGAPYEAIVIR